RFAEAPGEGNLLLRRHLLVAQKDHEMIQKSLAHLLDHVLFKVAVHIDADDLGAQGSRQWTNLDVSIGTHRPSSPLTARASPCTQRHPRELAAGATGPPGFPPHRRARRDHAPCLRPPPEVPPHKVNRRDGHSRLPNTGVVANTAVLSSE